jgi:small subunit ribosomal protein S9
MKVITATGRRKTAVSQCRIIPGTGKISVNHKAFEEYFPIEVHRDKVLQPFLITKQEAKFDMFLIVRGGGKSGQTGAVSLSISRALAKFDDQLHGPLRDAGLLTRDPRMVERKKYGQKKARKRFQFSKR